MSDDKPMLAAIASVLGEPVRFYDLVTIVWGPDKRKCVVVIGQRKLALMRQDFLTKISDSSELEYASIVKVVKDKLSEENYLLVLQNDGRWKSDRVFVTSQNRDLVLKHLQCCWQTHMMAHLSKPVSFPLYTKELTLPPFQAQVLPFMGYSWQRYRGYKFMRPDTMAETSNMVQTRDTGQFIDEATGITLKIHVHDVMTLEQLKFACRDHIRWVAVDYKAKLVEDESQFYVIRSGQRCKRMNLVSDAAAWSAWEIIIRTRSHTIICMLLRRSNMPPMCDVAQDISMIFRCSAEYWSKNEVQMALQAQLIADSLSPIAVPDTYRNLVQSKLNGLRFDEDGIEWVSRYQKLQTMWRARAVPWVYTIVSLFVKAGLLSDALLTDPRYLVSTTLEEDWMQAKPITNFTKFIDDIRMVATSYVPEVGDLMDTSTRKDRVGNRFLERVARYFAWATDGGFLGAHFRLEVLLEKLPQLEGDEERKATFALMFMLHWRDLDRNFPWQEEPLHMRLAEGSVAHSTFNERVMQWIINGEYLKKQFGRHNEAQYFKSLARVLEAPAGTTLKAYICRIFMEMRIAGGASSKLDEDANTVVVPALLHLIQSGGVYLATFASAALVNLSHENEMVKMQLMSQGLAQAAAQNLKRKDDDLICYTTTLMVNLTKEAHHRYIMANAKILPLLYDLLTSSYHQVQHMPALELHAGGALMHSPVKEKILANLCSLIGHFCKDEEYRDHIVDKFEHTVKCLCYIATSAIGGTPMMSKVLYALKQICASRKDQKLVVGAVVIKPLLQDQLRNKEVLAKCKPEFLLHAVLLLQMLSSFKDNCIRIDDVEGSKTLMDLLTICPDKLAESVKENIRTLEARIRDVINREHEIGAAP